MLELVGGGIKMDLSKPYDIAALVVGFKSKGLDVAEGAAKAAVEAVIEWFEASAKLSATPFDDVALVVLPKIKDEVLKLVDKIDGQPG